MASTTSFGRAKCKCNVAGKVCTCQEWVPSEEDDRLCECCEHHMSFHEPLHPIASGYGRCVREFDDAESSHEDGFQEFFPSWASSSRICAGCGCHRSYHEKVTVGVGELAGPPKDHLQEQDSLSGDPSTSLLQSNSKRMRLDPTIIPSEADSEHEQAAGFGHELKNESDMADLEPKHKVFLSHSGAQKDFVEQLCIDLERCDRYPFFDKRRSSLPVGLKFPERLFAAIQQAEVGVVVLSEEFFSKTKWPMLELVEMVRARSMKIVPVFWGISREVCRNLQSQERWMEQWKEWAKTDKTIDIEEWTLALKIFGSTTGVSLKDGEVSLRREVVDAVCELVLPESRWDDSNVEGKDRLCQVILDKVGLEVEDPEVADPSTIRVVGVYGVGGIGKTTMCKVLCNKLFKEFRGRVCHMELMSTSQVESRSAMRVELFQESLKILTNTRHDDLKTMNLDKCKDQLRRCIVNQPIFLAIDNVDENSAEQAMTYLRAKHSFGNGSVVVVTSRSLGQLKALNIPKDDCLGVPELELHEAKELFRNHAKSVGTIKYELDERIITRCVEMCRFKKDGESYHYHPLALTVLGNEVREQMACNNFDPSLWSSRFSRIEESYKVLETKKQIFSILRISYDTLLHDDQMLFMDVALFVGNSGSWDSNRKVYFGPDLYEWLGMVHGLRKHDELKARLERLQKKSLLEKVGDGSTDVIMHDLWREFCVAETKAGKFADRRWVWFCCNELGESSPSGSCWEKLERMYILSEASVQKLFGLRLDHFSNVKVLRVHGYFHAMDSRVLDLGKMIHLKYLEIMHYGHYHVVRQIEVRGLQSLTKLAFMDWIGMPVGAAYATEIGCLSNLQFLKLPFCRGNMLPDMSKLTSVRMAFFESCEVETITGLTGKLTNLQYLNLAYCAKLRSCPGVGNLVGLKSLDISRCRMLEELPNLGKLTKLTDLNMNGCSSLRVCPGLCGLRNLLRMDISCCSLLSTLPSLSDLVSLEKLSARDCTNLSEFPDMCNLKKLQVLDILGCPVKTLPGFEGLISLRELTASFELLEDRPALHNLTSLRHVEIEGCNGPGLMSIAKHAMLESLHVSKCEKRSLQLNLRNMERLQRLQFDDIKYVGILKDLRLAFYNGELEDVCTTHACQLKEVIVRGCRNLEVLELINIPGLQKLMVWDCTLKRLSIREPSGALRLMNRNGPREWERVSDSRGLQELDVIVCRRLTSYTSKKPLSALKELDLSGCESLEALQDLRCFPHLETLDLHGCKRLRSLNSRVPLLALEKLDLSGCTSLATLPDLSIFLNLRKLKLRRCESLTEITSDKPLAALKKVSLRRCRNVKALPDLANFPQLKTLNLHCCESLTSFSCSVPLLALEKLDLSGCTSLATLPDLSNFLKLRELNLSERESLTEITSDKPLAALKKLNVWRCRNLKALPDLGNLPQLKSVDLHCCESLTSCSCSVDLLALEKPCSRGCISLESLPDLSYFPDLKSLRLIDCKSFIRISSEEPLRALQILKLWSCNSLVALPDLSFFPDLHELRLHGCQSLIRITSEEPLRALKVLRLRRCKSLAALPDLSYFPDLISLTLSHCERLTSVNCGVPLLALANLDLGGCISLKQLPDLSNFLSLKRVDLKRCESLVGLTSSEPLPALCLLDVQSCRSLTALPDHLRGSVKLQHLRVWGSGIELSEDTVSKLLTSCVELKSVESSGHILGEDSELDDRDELYGDSDGWDFDSASDGSDSDSASDGSVCDCVYDSGSDRSFGYSDPSDFADEFVSDTDDV